MECDFFKSQLHYLGHLFSQENVSPLPEKIPCNWEGTWTYHVPSQNIKELQKFVGLTHYADITNKLTRLLIKS